MTRERAGCVCLLRLSPSVCVWVSRPHTPSAHTFPSSGEREEAGGAGKVVERGLQSERERKEDATASAGSGREGTAGSDAPPSSLSRSSDALSLSSTAARPTVGERERKRENQDERGSEGSSSTTLAATSDPESVLMLAHSTRGERVTASASLAAAAAAASQTPEQ